MSIFVAELIGTFLLIVLGNGVVANVLLTRSKGHHGGWISITAGWGFAVAIAVYATGWISGGHFNPAITLGFMMSHITPMTLVPYYLLGQFAGAMLGALAVWLCYFPHWEKTESPQLKLLCFATGPAIRRPGWNLVTEIFGTAVLLVGVLGIFDRHNGMSNGIWALCCGHFSFQHRTLTWRADRLRNQPRARPRAAHHVLSSTYSGKRESGLAVCLGAHCRPAYRSCLRRAHLQGVHPEHACHRSSFNH